MKEKTEADGGIYEDANSKIDINSEESGNSIYEDANSKIDINSEESGNKDLNLQNNLDESFYSVYEPYGFDKNAMIVDLSRKDNDILREAQSADGIGTVMQEKLIDIGSVNNFDDFKEKLIKDNNISIIYHKYNDANDGYYFTECKEKTIYLKFNKLYLKLEDFNNICFNENDGKIIITDNNIHITFEINKTQIKIYNNTHSSDDRYEYVYDIKHDRLLFRNDSLDNLELYEYKTLDVEKKDKYFYPQWQEYLSNIRRTWGQKQQPMNLLQSFVGINQQVKPKTNNNYTTCLCGLNCCSGYDVDVIYDDIRNGNNDADGKTAQWSILSLEEANNKISAAINNKKH